MKIGLRAALLMVLALVVTACGVSNVSGSSAGEGEYALVVTNGVGQRICYLYVSPSTSSDWGEDYLGENGVLENGGTFTVRVAEKGDYDLMVMLEGTKECDGEGRQITNMGYTIDGTDDSWTPSS